MIAEPDLTPISESARANPAPPPANIRIIVPAAEPIKWPKKKSDGKPFKMPLPPPKVWEYRLSDGSLYGAVARWDRDDGKVVLPCVYAEVGGELRWAWSGFGNDDGSRPLLGLVELSTNPLATVLIVEGEKARDAAPKYLPPNWVCMTWQGGGKAVKKTDWSPLAGRRVVIWPDKDAPPVDPKTGKVQVDPKTGRDKLPPGEETARELYILLNNIGAGVAQIPVYGPSLKMIPNNGWDLADPVPDGLNPTEWMERAAAQIAMPAPQARLPQPNGTYQGIDNEPPPADPADYWDGKSVPPDADGTDPTAEYRALGYSQAINGTLQFHFFAARSGFIISLASEGVCARTGIYNLCHNDSYWREHYDLPRDKFEKLPWTHIGTRLMEECYKVGYFKPDNERGRGAWIDEGRVVMHLGQTLIVDNRPVNPSKMKSEYFYPVRANFFKPTGAAPLTDDEGKALRKVFRFLNWDNPFFAELMGGWIATAPVCGALDWLTHFWLTGPSSAGKAQPHSSAILTRGGWRKMGDIKPGDYVTAHDGTYAKVLKVHPQGAIPVYRIRFSDGRETRASADHLWKVRWEGAQWKLRTTADLLDAIQHDGVNAKAMAIPVCQPVAISHNHEIDLPIHPYVLGVLLGDGHFGNTEGSNKAGEIRLTTTDQEILDRVKRLAPNGTSFFATNQEHSYRLGAMSRYASVVRPLIRQLRLLGARSHTKFIPSQYLNASIEERWELLRGLMDTDGTAAATKANLSYCTTSPQLRDDFITLVRSLGGIARWSEKRTAFTYKGEHREGRTAYIISLRLPRPSMAFTLTRKLARVATYGYENSFYLGIESIEPDGEEECSCITIDHPDRLYLTDDFVVTHNSWIANNIVSKCLGKIAIYPLGNSTAAGILGDLGRDARAVVFDEAEGKGEEGIRRRQMIIEMMRYSSTDSPGEVVKGTAGHGVARFRVRSQYFLASIGVGLTETADLTRTVVCGIKQRSNMDSFQQLQAMVKELPKDLPERLLMRQLKNLRVLRENAETFAKIIALRTGSRRLGDMIGTLMAGDHSLITSTIISDKDAEERVDDRMATKRFDDFNRVQESGEDVELFQHIASFTVRIQNQYGVGYDLTIGEVMALALDLNDHERITREECLSFLKRIGLLAEKRDGIEGFWIARAKTSFATNIMGKSAYPQGWERIILRHPMAVEGKEQKNFNGFKQRAIWLPYRILVCEEIVPLNPAE